MTSLFVDNFAGAGGASTGIWLATGRHPDIAVNHWPAAITMHRANHPGTHHYCENVWAVDPREACAGRPVDFAWFSPDCTHFSRAKGNVPRSKAIRGLAWIVHEWAMKVRPRVIILENVPEFATWGPLDDEGYPIKARAGETYREWLGHFAELGYQVETRTLVAADYGAPTSRKRLFLIARCDGRPIVWPEPTHGPGRALPWRSAASIIDWSIPCPSIFERKRPLAEKTQARIAEGLRRYVLTAARPFIVPVTHGAKRGGVDGRSHSLDEPLRTVTSASRGELALVAPTLIQRGYGERPGQRPRALDLHEPLGTVVAGGTKHALVAAFLSKHYGGSEGGKWRAVGSELEAPVGTVTAQDHHTLTAAFLTKFYGTSIGSSVELPLPTIAAQAGRLAEVRAFLTRHRIEQAHVNINGEPYVISDIGMRMLSTRELFRAQGFPESYVIDGLGLTKTQQNELAGNSVCPPLAEALVRANVHERDFAEAAE